VRRPSNTTTFTHKTFKGNTPAENAPRCTLALQLPIRRFYQDTLSLAAITAEKRIGVFLNRGRLRSSRTSSPSWLPKVCQNRLFRKVHFLPRRSFMIIICNSQLHLFVHFRRSGGARFARCFACRDLPRQQVSEEKTKRDRKKQKNRAFRLSNLCLSFLAKDV
jgi:hypothetical protein